MNKIAFAVAAALVLGLLTPARAAPPYPPASSSALDAAVRAACPQIDGVSVDGTIFFQPGASCQAAALAAMQNFVPADPAVEKTRQDAVKADSDRAAMLARLKAATPAQIDAWVNSNVTTLAEARKAIAIILKVIAIDPR